MPLGPLRLAAMEIAATARPKTASTRLYTPDIERRWSMKILITAGLVAALAGATAFAQSSTPSSADPSTPQSQPQTQAPAQPEGQPQAQQPEPQPAPPTMQAPTSSQAAASQAQPAGGTRIAPGSVIPVQLTKTIDAKKVKVGDPVMAKVTMDLKTNSGELLVPKDTKVTGHVTEAQARSKDQKESQLGIAFDHATLKSGDVSLPMSIQAVIAPPSNDANSSGAGSEPAPAGTNATSPMGNGRNGSAGSAAQPQPSGSSNAAQPTSSEAQQQGGNAQPQITGNTQGVIGISNLKLEAGQSATQGSVLSSEKNNVKVESGTMLLLRVSQ